VEAWNGEKRITVSTFCEVDDLFWLGGGTLATDSVAPWTRLRWKLKRGVNDRTNLMRKDHLHSAEFCKGFLVVAHARRMKAINWRVTLSFFIIAYTAAPKLTSLDLCLQCYYKVILVV